MLTNAQRKLGYKEIVYNFKTQKFYTFKEGDNYEDLNVNFDSDVNLNGYATESWVESKGYITLAEVPSVDAHTKDESDARYLAVNISTLSELPTV